MANLLFIDNFDSFTYNLVDEFEKRSCNVLVYRNNVPVNEINKVIQEFKPQLVVISPGPSAPSDAGNSKQIIRQYYDKIPILGICLGHQCIVEVFGGRVEKAQFILHGKSSQITHNNDPIFKNLPQKFMAARYHSLHGTNIPLCLEIIATSDNMVMGVKHKLYPIYGLQFHPESILTPLGGEIIKNILAEALK